MTALVGLAIVLVILWVIARVFLAVTSALFHLLWIAAIVLAIFWAIRKFTG